MEEWGETDCLLTVAHVDAEALFCPCGCGFLWEVSHDPDRATYVEPGATSYGCHVRARMDTFHQDFNPDDLRDGQVLTWADTHEDAWTNTPPPDFEPLNNT